MQASLPINQQQRWNFWNLPYPFGIANINTLDQLDIDEAAFFVESANRGKGKSHLSVRCRDDGSYGHSQKTNLLACISGEHPGANNDAFRMVEMWESGGTTATRFINFIQRILDRIGPGTPQRRRCFTMDNLTSHQNLLVLHMIIVAGHRVVFRAPCHQVADPSRRTVGQHPRHEG